MTAESALEVARLARAFGCSMADVRAMTYRDVAAMSEVLREEAQARKRAKRGR